MDTSRKLISFDICPFVQKARIVFALKGLEIPTEFIDLDRKPRWFLDRVPTGKVPVLLENDATIFESNVILEYADEVTPGRLLPSDPLARARERAWMVYADELIMAQYRVLSAPEADAAERHLDTLFRGLAQLESAVAGRGPDLGLLECAAAPVFCRIEAVPILRKRFARLMPANSPVAVWAQRIVASDAVQHALPDRFSERLLAYFAPRGSFIFARSEMPA